MEEELAPLSELLLAQTKEKRDTTTATAADSSHPHQGKSLRLITGLIDYRNMNVFKRALRKFAA